MKVLQFSKLVHGVKIFFNMIGQINVQAAHVLKSDPHEYAMALRAAAGAAGCPVSQLSLVIFGRTMDHKNYIRNRKIGYVQAAELRHRLECLDHAVDLVKLTFGEPEQSINQDWHDQTAVLFS